MTDKAREIVLWRAAASSQTTRSTLLWMSVELDKVGGVATRRPPTLVEVG